MPLRPKLRSGRSRSSSARPRCGTLRLLEQQHCADKKTYDYDAADQHNHGRGSVLVDASEHGVKLVQSLNFNAELHRTLPSYPGFLGNRVNCPPRTSLRFHFRPLRARAGRSRPGALSPQLLLWCSPCRKPNSTVSRLLQRDVVEQVADDLDRVFLRDVVGGEVALAALLVSVAVIQLLR